MKIYNIYNLDRLIKFNTFSTLGIDNAYFVGNLYHLSLIQSKDFLWCHRLLDLWIRL